MARDVPRGPGPGQVRPRSTLEQGAPERRRVAPLEPRDGAPDVRNVVRIAAPGHGQHPLGIAEGRPGIVEPRRAAGVVDDLDAIERQVRDERRESAVAGASVAYGMEGVSDDGETALRVDQLDGPGGR